MADFAKAEFALNAVGKDGASVRDHEISAWEQTGVKPELLASAPPLPVEGRSLWAYFCQMHRRRQHGMNGPQPLTFAEVREWAALNRVCLDRWEIDAILGVDDAYIAASAEASKKGAT